MSRKIFITSDMALDDRLMDIAEQDQEAALIWPWFLTLFDDWGRAEAEPRRIKAQVFPSFPSMTAQRIGEITDLYVDVGMIRRYSAKGKTYLCIPPEKWFSYQTHIRGEKRETDKSRYPAPAAQEAYVTNPDEFSSAQSRANARSSHEKTASPSLSPSLSPSPSNLFAAAAIKPEPPPELPIPIVATAAASAAPSQKKSSAKTKTLDPTTLTPKPRNPYWDVLVEVLGHDAEPSKRGAWGKAIHDIKQMGGVPNDIKARAQMYQTKFAGMALTPTALAGNWHLCQPLTPISVEEKKRYDDPATQAELKRLEQEIINLAGANSTHGQT